MLPYEKIHADPNAAPTSAQVEESTVRRGTHLAPLRQGGEEAEYNVCSGGPLPRRPGRGTLGDRAGFWRWVIL